MEGEYTLTDKHGNRHPLKRLEVSTGSETLGVFIAMNGNQEAQIKSLTEKSKSFAAKMRTKQCDPNIAIYTYNASFIKSMEYCMPVTHLSKKIWTSIIHPAKEITLQRARMSSSFPTAALYDSLRYQGLHFEDPYTKQGIEKNSNLIAGVILSLIHI